MLSNVFRQNVARSSWRSLIVRYNSTAADADLRSRLMAEVKTAMKNKDSFKSTTLRSVLSEVYNADKASSEGKIDSSKIAVILRKAVERRSEAVAKFQAASRDDLAEKELQEVNIISNFLPPTLTEMEVDDIVSSILKTLPATNPPQRALGTIFKEFYSQVDKSRVDAELVKRRVQALMSATT